MNEMHFLWQKHLIASCFSGDSETNLKVKQAIPDTAELGDNIEAFGRFDGKLAVSTYFEFLSRLEAT